MCEWMSDWLYFTMNAGWCIPESKWNKFNQILTKRERQQSAPLLCLNKKNETCLKIMATLNVIERNWDATLHRHRGLTITGDNRNDKNECEKEKGLDTNLCAQCYFYLFIFSLFLSSCTFHFISYANFWCALFLCRTILMHTRKWNVFFPGICFLAMFRFNTNI